MANLSTKIEDFIAGRIEKHSPSTADEYFESREKYWKNTSKFDFALSNVRDTRSNISTLLTHISAMIAALGMLLVIFDGRKLTQVFTYFETMIYTLLASACVFVQKISLNFHPITKKKDKDSYEDLYILFLRTRYIYANCTVGVIANTILFMITIFAHAVTPI